MQITLLDDSTLAAGHAAFHDYLIAAVCGSGAAASYERAMCRGGGVASIPGTVNALIEQAIHDKDEIVCAAARVSRCRRSTVRKVIDAMTGPCPSTRLWIERGNALFFHEGAFGSEPPRFLIAA